MRKFETLFVILWHLKYCNFERCCGNEVKYHFKTLYVIKLLPLSISLVFGSVVYVIAFGIEKGFWVHFSWYLFLLLKTLLHLLYDNFGKSKVWVSLLLNLILYWRFLVTLLTPHEYKFAFFVTLIHYTLFLNLNSELWLSFSKFWGNDLHIKRLCHQQSGEF